MAAVTATGVEGCEKPEAEAGTGGCGSWAGFDAEVVVRSVARAGLGVEAEAGGPG